ncbi:MAG: winged helix-turn-helix transcriptional regulator [Patescibacteria group bacterium]|nr:winged helix-turn-helix transcriptional regulator [Patescibacteria group bacterium]
MASQTILIIIGIAIIILLLTRKGREAAVGICAAAIGQDAKKRENKEKTEALLKERGSLSNSDIREALGISDRSVIRYMDELEKEGKVEQVGSTGRGVVYRLK